jgi:DNA-binding MarR family transcriptional regulator
MADILNKHQIPLTKQQWIVLKILNDDQNGLIQNELAFITERNKASLTRIIDVMEKNHLVIRKASKIDGRKNLIYITPAGKQLFLKIKPVFLNSILEIQQGITAKEMHYFIQVMTKIQNNLKQHKI